MSVKVNAVTDAHNSIFGGHEAHPHAPNGHPNGHYPASSSANGSNADDWYMAALNAQEREERIELLRQCLELNPFHRRANALWEAMAAETATQKNIRFHTRSAILAGAVKAFLDRGWQLELEMNNIAQLKKRKNLPLKKSLIYSALFGALGAAAMVYRYFTIENDHAHLQLSDNGTLTVIRHRETREINTVEELHHIADTLTQRFFIPLTMLVGLVSTLAWMAVL